MQPVEVGQEPDTVAVIAAGGLGLRFGYRPGKQYVELCGLPMVCWSLLAYDACPSVGEIVLVCPPGQRSLMYDEALAPVVLTTPVTLVEGGNLRQDSCQAGVEAAADRWSMVAIHDAARPLITPDDIEGALATLRADQALSGVVCAQRCAETLKVCNSDAVVEETPDRSVFWIAQTPQILRMPEACELYRRASEEGYVGTDDGMLADHFGGRTCCYSLAHFNIKVTLPEDIYVAETVLERRLADDALGRGGSAR